MNNADKFLHQWFDGKKGDVSFITLKKGAVLKAGLCEYITDRELPVPIRVEGLIKAIENQSENEDITISNILDGILYLAGTDDEFALKDEYLGILSSLGINIEPHIIKFINNLEEGKADDAVIYGKALVNIKKDEKTCFVYASALEKKSIEASNDGNDSDGRYFTDEAMNWYERALDYNSKFSLSYYKLGYYYKLKERYEKAYAYWTKHQELSDDDMRTEEIRNELEDLAKYVEFERGYNLVLNDRPEEGLEHLLPLVNENSGWWNLLFFVGLAYRAQGEYKIAEGYFENVLKLSPYQKEALNELGLCKICRGKYTEAAELFTTLLNIEPGNCEVFCNRAVAYLYNGELERAKEDIRTALKINPDDEVARSIKEEIDKAGV